MTRSDLSYTIGLSSVLCGALAMLALVMGSPLTGWLIAGTVALTVAWAAID